MNQTRHTRQRLMLVCSLLPMLTSGTGCAESDDLAPANENSNRAEIMEIIFGDLSSANYLLFPDDLGRFRVGQSKGDVLKDVKWRGNFGNSFQYNGKEVCAITYEFVLQRESETMNIDGEWLFAVFVDKEFEHFLRPGTLDPKDEQAMRGAHLKIGDTSLMIRDLKSEPIDLSDIADLKKELKARPEAPSQIDPGLTTAYLLLKSQGLTPSPATVKDYKRNAQLRDQFNGARLNVGLSPKEVQATFKAKPLESGEVAAGIFEVYGSNESFDIDPALLYSNVLVLYKDGKTSVIYGIEGGNDWREKAVERFADFPRAPE